MTAGQPCRITALTEEKPNKTYQHTNNNHEHNNISWEQIRISAQEAESE